MSSATKQGTVDVRLLLRLTRELSKIDVLEQAYGVALNTIYEVFAPNRAFVALSEPGAILPEAHSARPGWLSDLVVPVFAGQKLIGRFMLQYDKPRCFSEHDVAVMEIIAAQTGRTIQHIQERRDAREACRQKEEIVAMAAHELRSPLTAIMGASFILRAGRAEERIRALDIIDRNARTQVNLIDELLSICQLDAGHVELEMIELDLVSVLERVIEEIRPTAAASNTSLQADLKPQHIIRGDAQRLWQIFWNLLANSVRFASPNGEVRISSDQSPAVAKICIRDNGIGIAADQLPHIFERFRRAHVPQLKPSAGLGLGLAIVKDLVAMHGGTVVAESDGAGKGACFTVTLPAL